MPANVDSFEETQPSLKNLTRADYGDFDKTKHKRLNDLLKPHVDSFNWFLNEGIKLIPQALSPMQIKTGAGDLLMVKCIEVFIDKPKLSDGVQIGRNLNVFPSTCRQMGITYEAQVLGKFSVFVNSEHKFTINQYIGSIPMMVNSTGCSVYKMTPKELVQHKEEEDEMGGYFIINGKEKVIRMVEAARRNFPITIARDHFKQRGQNFTKYAIYVRSVAKTQFTKQLWVHYLNNGTFSLSLLVKKSYYSLPLMLVIKAFVSKLDIEIYKEMICTKENDTFFKTCVQNMLRQFQSYNFTGSKSVFAYIGKVFGHKLTSPTWICDEERGELFLKESVLVHLSSYEEKFRFLCFLTRKVYDFASEKCFSDGLDSVQIAELLLPGHLYQVVMIDKLNGWLTQLGRGVMKGLEESQSQQLSSAFINACFTKVRNITDSFSSMMATGNLSARDTLGLPQTIGLSLSADKLNFLRYLSHFRAVHKGAKFKTMRDTSCRRLMPDSWGFLCPVHTPDGTPCGLLNHLAHLCEVVTHPSNTDGVVSFLHNQGLILPGPGVVCGSKNFYPVLLDGTFLGWLPAKEAKEVTKLLRIQKVVNVGGIPSTMEICLIEFCDRPTQYPGLYLFSEPARMVRPVLHIGTGKIEMIGTFEQMYMDVCVIPEEAHELTTHQEVNQHSILSAVASLTPFSDHNQSPRNMYQCQMAKQTMGTCSHTIEYRSDNKMYRIITAQSPIVRPYMYDLYKIDNFCLGTNAIVAVISYTGYDLEDAMILNKSSVERGFCWGSIYKTEIIDLNEIGAKTSSELIFGQNSDSVDDNFTLGSDGLPYVGQRLEPFSQYYSYVNVSNKKMTVVKYDGSETAIVDNVKVINTNSLLRNVNRVSITLRIPRNPMIGDKFASRHGQKGVCSRLWPVESIPFTENGMYPDIIFNPHGFPSRMTIGMMIESMAGKAAAVNGECYDATPFTFGEDNPAIEHFGELLTKAGFNYYGTETLYSGISGLELEAEIFFGVVYYQRLRHMVSDKFQVRTTGPVDQITQQPVKGRKRGGGIRFGEMERDALLAHGAAMLLHDRLMTNSDLTQAYVCEKCKSILSPILDRQNEQQKCQWRCKICNTDKHLTFIDIPYVYRYLVNELAAMNIKTIITLE